MTSRRLPEWLALVGMLALALAVYEPALHGAFLWDDAIIFDDDKIRSGSSPWTWWTSLRHTDYWPISYTVFWAMYRVFGDAPLPYHLLDVALHVANAALLGCVLRRLGTVAWPAVLLFLLHPVQVETAAYVFQLKTLLATTFVLLAMLAYLRGWLALSLLAFAASLLSKSSTAMLPAVLLLHAWWSGRRSARELLGLVPHAIVAAVLVGLAMYVNARNHGPEVVWDAGFLERILTAAHNVWFYLGSLLLPVALTTAYPRVSSSPSELVGWLPLVGAVAATAGVVIAARRPWGRVAALGLGFFVLNLVPALGFTNIYYMKFSLVADHWQYLASIGVLGLASPLYVWVERRAATGTPLVRRAPRIIVGLLLLGCALASWRRAHMFTDSRTFWRTTVEESPDSALAHNNWGVEQSIAGYRENAITEYRRARALDPGLDDAAFNLGYLLERHGKPAEAETHYRAAIALTPDHARALTALGALLARSGRFEEAQGYLQTAVDSPPRSDEALRFLELVKARRAPPL